ncbi:DUF2147 domain-containing protein [Roseobacter sp.]|uniref:DUF2147 domain-containing protein n=1 Tax=Roseobacter sp. TaxID=1907202 RepID=UPI0038580920
MKTNVASFLLFLTLAGACGADPLEGLWQTEADDGAYAHVKIEPCGEGFCGKIAKTFNETGSYASPNLGKTLVIDMVAQSGGTYKGKVWRPSNNKIYLGKVTLTGDSMELAGCIAGGLICSKQTWSRIE